MSEKIFKVNEPITIVYQAVAGSTTATLTVYKNDWTVDATKSGSMAMVTTSIFVKDFTPDVVRDWTIQVTDNKNGKVIARYSVGNYNLDAVGSTVDVLNGKLDNINTNMAKDSTVAKDATVAKDSTVAKASVLAVTDGKVDTVNTKADLILGSINNPPMIG